MPAGGVAMNSTASFDPDRCIVCGEECFWQPSRSNETFRRQNLVCGECLPENGLLPWMCEIRKVAALFLDVIPSCMESMGKSGFAQEAADELD